MRYTQSQIRGLVSISVDDLKTWRKAIPALASHKGHAPTFTPGDVVAMAVVAELVHDFGLRIGTLAGRLDSLFKLCHGRSWLSLENCSVLIGTSTIRLIDAGAPIGRVHEMTTIVVPCAPIVTRLQSILASTEAETAQGYLHFPPTGIARPSDRREMQA